MTKPGISDWEECAPKAIASVVTQAHVETRRAALRRIGLTSAGIFSVIASGTLLWAGRQPTREEYRRKMVIPIKCCDVLRNLGCYHRCHLEDALTRRIAHHLQVCCKCRDTYTAKFNDAVVQSAVRSAPELGIKKRS